MPNVSKIEERRRSSRMGTRIKAVAKTSQGARHAVEVNNLSQVGCAVVSPRHPLKPGLAYGLKIDGLETLGAVAAWTVGTNAGLQFDRALHPAVADHLVRINPPAEDDAEQALSNPAGDEG